MCLRFADKIKSDHSPCFCGCSRAVGDRFNPLKKVIGQDCDQGKSRECFGFNLSERSVGFKGNSRQLFVLQATFGHYRARRINHRYSTIFSHELCNRNPLNHFNLYSARPRFLNIGMQHPGKRFKIGFDWADFDVIEGSALFKPDALFYLCEPRRA